LTGGAMAAEVTLDLREGFFADEVVASADGMDSVRAHDVTTRTQTGHARSLALPLPASAPRLRIELPALGLTQDIALPAERPLWVGVSLARARDRLEVQLQQQPFGYV